MTDETTLPPVPPQKWKRAWLWAVALVGHHPDTALGLFLIVLGVAMML